MFSWIFIFIPVIASVLLLFFWIKKVVWWEIAILIVPSALIILLLNTVMVWYRTGDTEYLSYYTTKTTYYEPWNERVSCRHPIYCTRSYPCGKSICTSTYICGYYHPYDVDYHPERYSKGDNGGGEHYISKEEFVALTKRFNTKQYFVELNRDFHTIDGNAYCTDFAGEPERSDVITVEHSYMNKIKASHSIFKFEDISQEEADKIGLFDYPDVNCLNQSVVLGHDIDIVVERKLQYINGKYGKDKQFKMFILLFIDKDRNIANKQKSYWEGGNKNEFVTCLGVDKSGGFLWVDCFSWMDKPALEINVENYFFEKDTIDLNAFSEWMPDEVNRNWHRKDFKDFDYLQIELTGTQLTWLMIILALFNIVASIWIVLNEIKNE